MNEIIITGGKAVLTGQRTPALFAILPRLEGQRRWAKDGLHFEPTGRNLALLESGVGARVKGATRSAVFDAPPAAGPARPTVKRKTTPMPHQKAALEHFGDRKVMALFMEQGTGKTKTVIDWADDLFAAGEITGMIVVTRNGVHSQWMQSELPRHMASKWTGIHWGSKAIKGLPDGLPKPKRGHLEVISINWDGIKTVKGDQWLTEFALRHRGRLLIVADEAQDMKNPSSQRHKSMMTLKPHSSHRAVLTGTPIARDLTDEWAILRWLDEDILGIRYITAFRAEFCVMGGYGGREVIGHREIARFRQMTAPFVYRVRKTDIGLQPKVYDVWTFDLTKEQKAMIRQIKEDLRALLETGESVTAPTAAVAMIRSQQIASGFVTDEDGTVHRIMPVDKNPRAVAAMEWLQASDSKAIIWCRFREDIAIMSEAMTRAKIPHQVYMGGVKPGEKQAAIDAFLDADGAQVFLATDAASTGLNLQGLCNRALYYTEGFNAVNRWQKEDRIDRIGTVGFTVHTDLVGKGSIDRSIHRNRAKKRGISDMAIEGLRDADHLDRIESDFADILAGFLDADADDDAGSIEPIAPARRPASIGGSVDAEIVRIFGG